MDLPKFSECKLKTKYALTGRALDKRGMEDN